MRKLNNREKNLALFVLFMGLIVFWGQVKMILDRSSHGLSEELHTAEQNLKQNQTLLAKVAPPPPSQPTSQVAALPENRLTLLLLSDITKPKEANHVKVLRVERTSDRAFRIIVEASFQEMMQFIGMLERANGHFEVAGGEVAKMQETASSAIPSQKKKLVHASFTLNLKG